MVLDETKLQRSLPYIPPSLPLSFSLCDQTEG